VQIAIESTVRNQRFAEAHYSWFLRYKMARKPTTATGCQLFSKLTRIIRSLNARPRFGKSSMTFFISTMALFGSPTINFVDHRLKRLLSSV
jgi:hypothetical protein